MAKIQLVRHPSGALVPLDEADQQRVAKLAAGEIVEATVHYFRHPQFHRKFMKMIRFGYNQYVETLHEDEHAMTFDNFRRKVVMLAGFVEETVDLDGNITVEPKSISFENMEQDEFELVYPACAKVLLAKILTNWKPEDLDEAVEIADNFMEGFMA